MTFDKELIVRRASYGGASGCGVDFLKSEATAQQVAERLWQNLRKSNSSLERERIKVKPSAQHRGTWLVKYSCVPLARGVPGAAEINARRGNAIEEAVKASYSPDDLVDSWTTP